MAEIVLIVSIVSLLISCAGLVMNYHAYSDACRLERRIEEMEKR